MLSVRTAQRATDKNASRRAAFGLNGSLIVIVPLFSVLVPFLFFIGLYSASGGLPPFYLVLSGSVQVYIDSWLAALVLWF